MPNPEYWGVPDGTYQTNHGAASIISTDFFIPDVAGTLSYIIDLSDLHGFAGWPAGGTGGSQTLYVAGDAGSQSIPLGTFPPSGSISPGTHTGALLRTGEIIDGGVLALLKGETWHWGFDNGDNRESWSLTSIQIEIYPTDLGPFVPPVPGPGDIVD